MCGRLPCDACWIGSQTFAPCALVIPPPPRAHLCKRRSSGPLSDFPPSLCLRTHVGLRRLPLALLAAFCPGGDIAAVTQNKLAVSPPPLQVSSAYPPRRSAARRSRLAATADFGIQKATASFVCSPTPKTSTNTPALSTSSRPSLLQPPPHLDPLAGKILQLISTPFCGASSLLTTGQRPPSTSSINLGRLVLLQAHQRPRLCITPTHDARKFRPWMGHHAESLVHYPLGQ